MPTGLRQLVHCPETERDVMSRIRKNFDRLKGPQFTLTPYRAVKADTTASIDDIDGTIDCDTTAGDILVVLLTANGVGGRQHVVRNGGSSGNDVTIKAAKDETINGAATLVLTDGLVARLQSTGTSWIRL